MVKEPLIILLNGPDDTDNRGRWIPTTSVDQYAATLANWYGLAASDLATVFPYLSRFASSNLGLISTGYGNRPYRGNTAFVRLLYLF